MIVADQGVNVRVFHSWNCSSSTSLLSGILSLPNRLRLPLSPTHFRRQLLGHTAFTALEVPLGSPTTRLASLPTSLSLIGSLISVPPENHASSPEVTRCSS